MVESGAEESVLTKSKIQIIGIDNNSEFCVVTISGRGFTKCLGKCMQSAVSVCKELTFTTDVFVTSVVIADPFLAALSVIPVDRDASLLTSRDKSNPWTLTRCSPMDFAALCAGSNSSTDSVPKLKVFEFRMDIGNSNTDLMCIENVLVLRKGRRSSSH